jgi:hypothetical protein
MMGKARAEGRDRPNLLLFLDKSVDDAKDKFVGFNLRTLRHLGFEQQEKEFVPKLRENLEYFFNLKQPS